MTSRGVEVVRVESGRRSVQAGAILSEGATLVTKGTD